MSAANPEPSAGQACCSSDLCCLGVSGGSVAKPEYAESVMGQYDLANFHGPGKSYQTRFHKIDLHTHILPEHFPDLAQRYGYGDFIRLEHHEANKARMFKGDKFFREVEANCYRPEARIAEMDQQGVSVQVLSTVPVMFSYWAKPEDTLDLCRMLNDHLAEICRKHPTRFVGLGTLPMQAPELAVQELERCVKVLGLRGVQIGSHINNWTLAEPKLFPVFEAAERLGAAVFVHPWDMMGTQLMEKYWLPWLVGMPAESSLAVCSLIFGGVLERLPKLRVCIAHGGGAFPSTIGRIEHGFRCRPDLVAVDNPHNPREYLDRLWVDSLVHDPVQLTLVRKLLGEDKVCLGTDYPFPLGEAIAGELAEWMQWSDADKAQLLWQNGLRFLDLEAKAFVPEAEINGIRAVPAPPLPQAEPENKANPDEPVEKPEQQEGQ